MLIFGLVRFHVSAKVNAIGVSLLIVTLLLFAVVLLATSLRSGRVVRDRRRPAGDDE